jgi:outer membrane beta-barrel protein
MAQASRLLHCQRLVVLAPLALSAVLPLFLASESARADAQGNAPPASATQPVPSTKAERMDVDQIRRKYWERGEDADARVIQNRLYSKALKFELGLYYGSISTDPFLSVTSFGGSLGFHFTEAWGLNLLYWKDFVSNSSATTFLQEDTNDTANTNPPSSFAGGEVAYSPIYGKISVFGEWIVHYDLHLLGGYGITSTRSGSDGTISIGIGQQFYLTRWMSLRLDYRAMHYNENVENPAGQVVLQRGNWTDAITLGVTAFLGPIIK